MGKHSIIVSIAPSLKKAQLYLSFPVSGETTRCMVDLYRSLVHRCIKSPILQTYAPLTGGTWCHVPVRLWRTSSPPTVFRSEGVYWGFAEFLTYHRPVKEELRRRNRCEHQHPWFCLRCLWEWVGNDAPGTGTVLHKIVSRLNREPRSSVFSKMRLTIRISSKGVEVVLG